MKLFVDGEEVDLEAEGRVVHMGGRLLVTTNEGTHSALAVRKGDAILVSYRGRQFTITQSRPRTRAAAAIGDGEILAPMPGQIVDVRVELGAAVVKGQVLVVLEAMKTQQPFSAPFDGTVESLPVAVGQLVAEGAALVKIAPVPKHDG
jgi:acetyl/propionyl-CoA carboxylase alpha subunit